MEKSEFTSAQPSTREKVYKILDQNRLLNVKLRGHSWASVSIGKKEITRNRRRDPNIKFFLRPGTYTIKTDGIIEDITSKVTEPAPSLLDQIEDAEFAQLRLTSDARDKHVIDGTAEISADGKSFCTITVEKIGLDGVLLSGKEHNDSLYLRSTGGTLMDAKGEGRIRSFNLIAGKGAFRVVSERQPKVVTISVLAKPPILRKAELQIEFV